MFFLAKYNTQTTFTFPMVKRGVVDFATTSDWTPATGDTKISKDAGNVANTTNNPAAVGGTGSVSWTLTLTAAELSAAVIDIQIVDSATKAVEDQFLKIYTYGNASAKIPADLSDTVRLGLTALPNAAAEAAGGLYTRGTGAGQINQPANGQIDANAVKLGGTTQTGRDIGANVLLSPGTGTGQVDLSSGKVLLQATQSGVTIPTVTSVTNDIGITQTGADKVWGSTTRTLTAFSTALAISVWDVLLANISTASSIGLKLKNWVLGSDNKSLLSSDAQTGVTIPTVTTLTNAPSDSPGVTTLLSRLSALRAGYLDNLSAGAAALESSLQSLITTVGAAGAGLTATASAVWSVATRLLTAGTNIVLAKGTGVTGFNDLSAADVNAEVDTALADYDGPTHTELTAELADLPTVAQIVEGMFLQDSGQVFVDAVAGSPVKEIADNAGGSVADEVWSLINGVQFPFPSTGILDNFNRADEGPPPSGWITGIANGFGGFTEPGHEIISNQLANTFQDVAQNYRAEEAGPDCEFYITVADGTGLASTGVAARLTEVGRFTCKGYAILVQPSADVNRNYTIYRIDNGVLTIIASGSESGVGSSTGDKYGIRCVGNNIQLWADTGEGWKIRLWAIDSTYSSAGFPGIVTESDPFARWDDFGGGNVVFPSKGTLLFNAGAIADEVWEEPLEEHDTDGSSGKKLANLLYPV
jgi:hypothetical protein